MQSHYIALKVGPVLIVDEGLVEAAVAVEDLDDGVVDVVLEFEEDVEVAEADVGVNGDHREAQTMEALGLSFLGVRVFCCSSGGEGNGGEGGMWG